MNFTKDNEKLVQASLYPDKILVKSWYFGEGLPGSLPEAWLRESVYERLLIAAESLSDGMRLIIWDGWRSYELQKFLFDTLYSRYKAKGFDDDKAYELKNFCRCTFQRPGERIRTLDRRLNRFDSC